MSVFHHQEKAKKEASPVLVKAIGVAAAAGVIGAAYGAGALAGTESAHEPGHKQIVEQLHQPAQPKEVQVNVNGQDYQVTLPSQAEPNATADMLTVPTNTPNSSQR